MEKEKPYWEGKEYSFSVIRTASSFRVIKVQTRMTLTACSVTARCMH